MRKSAFDGSFTECSSGWISQFLGLPCPSPFEIRCGEPVGEVERGRPFTLYFFFGSCLNAHESPNEHWPFVIRRMQSLLSDLFWAFQLHLHFTFPLPGAPIAGRLWATNFYLYY